MAPGKSPFVGPWVIVTAGAVGMTVVLALLPTAGHDQLWLLLAAQRMLAAHTANPYGPTVFESNPPLAIWLSAVVVRLAGVLHLSVTVALKLAGVVSAAAVAAVCAALLRRLRPELTVADRVFLLCVFVLVFGAVPVRDFGQRDHVLALLVLPYLLGAALGLAGRPLSRTQRAGLAVVAAVGLALKPHQALVAVAVEAALVLGPRIWGRGFRAPRVIEPGVFLLAAVGYFGAIQRFAQTYLTEVLPVLRQTYWAFGRLNLVELQRASVAMHLLAFAALLRFGFRLRLRPEAIQPIVPVLLSAGVGAACAYTAQGTGWYYQQLPAISFFALAIAFQVVDLTDRKAMAAPRWLVGAAAGVTVLALGMATYFSHFARTPQGFRQPQESPDPGLFAGLSAGAAVATLTTSVDDSVEPAYVYGLTLAQRYPHLWMLPAILRNESGNAPGRVIPADRLAELEALQRRFMVEDLERWQPRMILVERCQDAAVSCQALEDRQDDLLAFFKADAAFARLFEGYRYLRSAGDYDAYVRVGN